MPDEKANNPFHWKNKLDELTGIPGEPPFDQPAAWQALHDRLQKKPLPRVATKYWIAAACLLCVIILSGLMLTQPDVIIVKRATQSTRHFSPKPVTQPVSHEADAVAFQPVIKNKPISPPIPKNNLHPSLVHAAVGRPMLLPDTTDNTLLAITIPQPHDTMHLTAAAPAKKKLRVVHINELNNTVDDGHLASNLAAASSKKSMSEDDAGLSLSRNASDNILKIKLSSSN